MFVWFKANTSKWLDQTVGTMLSSSYQHGPALIGAIFGTGTNGAYLEDLNKITKLGETYIKEQTEKVGGKMVINTEWGALDNSVSMRFFLSWGWCLRTDSLVGSLGV